MENTSGEKETQSNDLGLRYDEAYKSCNRIIVVAIVIQVIANVIGVLAFLAGMAASLQNNYNPLLSVVASALVAAIIWLLFRLPGAVVMSTAQANRALLDVAVTNAFFLSEEEKLAILRRFN